MLSADQRTSVSPVVSDDCSRFGGQAPTGWVLARPSPRVMYYRGTASGPQRTARLRHQRTTASPDVSGDVSRFGGQAPAGWVLARPSPRATDDRGTASGPQCTGPNVRAMDDRGAAS
eukprot:1636862-Lingulodinium_polyedra.AAC.1